MNKELKKNRSEREVFIGDSGSRKIAIYIIITASYILIAVNIPPYIPSMISLGLIFQPILRSAKGNTLGRIKNPVYHHMTNCHFSVDNQVHSDKIKA